jgi:outer membrane protein assembly factor BamB
MYVSVDDDQYNAFSAKGDPGPWIEGVRRDGTGRVPGGTTGLARVLATQGRAPAAARRTRVDPAFRKEGDGYGAIRALDPDRREEVGLQNGRQRWVRRSVYGWWLGFGGGQDGDFVALDANTGAPVWSTFLGGANASGPMTYSVNGKQYVIGTAAGTMYAFALPD